MAASDTSTYLSEHFVESAGTILFDFDTHKICLLHLLDRNEFVLPKGRRNVGESRQQCALRETREETGYACHLLPVDMLSRACPATEEGVEGAVEDVARRYKGLREPIAVQMRELGKGEVEVIWWFVAAVNEGEEVGKGEEGFRVVWAGYEEAVQRLFFKGDLEVIRRTVELIESTYGGRWF